MRVEIPGSAIVFAAWMIALGGYAPVSAAPIAPPLHWRGVAPAPVIEVGHRRKYHHRHHRRIVQIYPRIAPSYSAYDFPYYYSRGYYPTHIPPGYFYDGYPYNYGGRPYSRLWYRYR